MAEIKPFQNITQEDTLQSMLLVLMQIYDKLPRSDANDRMIVTHTESEGYQMVTRAGSTSNPRAVDLWVPSLSTAGFAYIYDNIQVL